MELQQVSNATRTFSDETEVTDTELTCYESISGRTLDALGPWQEVISRRKLHKNMADVIPTPPAQQSPGSELGKLGSVHGTSQQRHQAQYSSSSPSFERSNTQEETSKENFMSEGTILTSLMAKPERQFYI
ncbi:hypothetical protein MRX96_038357 [Rhipicephalus microplus]